MSSDVQELRLTAEIQHRLMNWLRLGPQRIIVHNVFMGNSPWESDVVSITPSLYWTEYEIKTSVRDYAKDFHNKCSRHREPIFKHVHYACREPSPRRLSRPNGEKLIRPKHFYFVMPTGMLGERTVPSHCGLIEVNLDRPEGVDVVVTKSAPLIPSPTQLRCHDIFLVAAKLSGKFYKRDAWKKSG